METPEGRRRTTKGGDIVRFEPQDLRLVNADPTIRVSFEQVGCIRFCEKLQGYNMQVEKEFSLRFNGIEAKWETCNFRFLKTPSLLQQRSLLVERNGSKVCN
jgi:ATP-dependent RNA circularization protein (DNA/RNA ligase family)